MLVGLSVWLTTDVGVVQSLQSPGYLARWRDQSGNGSDFIGINCTSSCNCNNAPCISPQALNGHDVISCAGSIVLAQTPGGPALEFGTGDFAVAEVFENPSALWTQNGGLALSRDMSGIYNFNISGAGLVVIPEMNAGAWHVLIARGAAMDMITDWGQSSTGPTNTTNMITTTGGGGALSLCDHGNIAEVVAVKGKLSDLDRASLMAYFKSKYKI